MSTRNHHQKSTTRAAELLRRVGEKLYGQHWQTDLANAISVSDRSLRRWLSGQDDIPEGVWRDVRLLVGTRGIDLRELEHKIGDQQTIVVAADPMPDDVAISFLARDQEIARAVAEQLEASGLSVFFYPRKQEELAGTNGMELMRAPFLTARVNVALFRHPWGETPWTRVEDAAIRDRCLNGGWPALMFVTLDKTSKRPKWLPDSHIRFAWEDYGIEQLIGAIKLRVQEQGGAIVPLNAKDEAKRVLREAEFLARREAMMSSAQWIADTVHRALREMITDVVRLAKETSAPGLEITAAANNIAVANTMACVLRSGFVSMLMVWKQPIYGRVSDYGKDECYLRAAEFSGAVVLPSEGLMVLAEPRPLKEHKFKVEVAHDGSLVWVEKGKKEHIDASKLAERIIILFLDLVSRANRGKVEPPVL